MFKAEILTGADPVLRFVFDFPVPESVQGHEEWQGFLALLDSAPGAEIARRDGAVTGFSLPLSAWKAMVAENRPEHDRLFQESLFDQLAAAGKGEPVGTLEVNFHQHPFDTPERYWLFTLNQGHFFSNVLNRLYWHLAPENGIVAPFPLHVDIETANTCNMNCPMCYRHMLKDIGQMELDLFRQIVDECAENHVYSVRLSWRGEPLTHPDIREMIAYAAKRIENVSFLTNAFYIDEDVMQCVIDNGVSYLAVSFDGIGEIYEAVRAPAKFQENFERLAELKRRREAAGVRLPQIRTCTVWPAIREDPEAYQRTMSRVADYMVKNPYINFAGPMTLKEDFICQYPWERIVVAFSGNAQCCTGWNADDIVLGNVRDKTIKEMWLGPQMDAIRKAHAEGRRMELSSCAKCRHGAKGDPDIRIEEIIERRY